MSWLPVSVTVAPASEPLTSAEVKLQARIDGTDEDDLLDLYISAARTFVENYTGTKLVSQTVLMQGSSFEDLYHLPVCPVISVSSVKYLDTDGAEQTLDTTVYEAVTIGLRPHIRLKLDQSWPSIRTASDAVRVTAVCGYSTLSEEIKAAMLVLIANWFDNRSTAEIPQAVHSLLSNHRSFAA